MAGHKRKIGIKAIKKALSNAVYDPEKSNWFRVVAESNDEYLLRRTHEMLSEILLDDQNVTGKLDQAITLLGLLKARNETVQA